MQQSMSSADSTENVQVLTDREHVLLRTETYLGTTEVEEITDYVVKDDGSFVQETVGISQAFAKVFDEILMNATDHRVRHLESPDALKQRCDTIKVSFSTEEGWIKVWNNGDGLEVRMHGEVADTYVPQLIFGQLRTGINFDDADTRFRSGRNGLGAKCANIFSARFELETLDAERKLCYKQTWANNMSEVTEPKITAIKAGSPKGYTSVKFWPDLQRLGLEKLTPEVVSMLRKRVYDIAATGPTGSKTYVDNKKVPVDTLQKYMKLHLRGGEKMAYEEPNERWKVGLACTPGSGFRCISFVNGLATTRGGTHVDHVLEPVIKAVQATLKKRLPDNRVTPANIKDHLTVFITSLVENPSFESQRKEILKTKVKDFGSVCKVSAEFLDKVVSPNYGLIKHLCEVVNGAAKADMLKDSDGRKTTRVRGIPKLIDAEFAGSPKSHKCILILCEGDSAATTCISGLSSLSNEMKKHFGIFPLRGKLLNVREASVAKLEGNAEITAIKKILGLQQGRVYDDVKSLRYGRIMIMTDQDVDGSHIKGLLINMIHAYWPRLLDQDFVTCLATPIVKAFPRKGGAPREFYTLTEFEVWWATVDASAWKAKWYKGLGTSTRQEAMTYFQDFLSKLITYHDRDGGAATSVPLAFQRTQASQRKEWLMSYNSKQVLDISQKHVSVKDFVHRELIHFSMDDVRRSIPSLLDGLVPSRRKIIWTSFQKGYTTQAKEVRVSQLAGAVLEAALYHHGEASLCQTIVRLAQDYVGSGNINLLHPSGQFGTRLQGGNDAASPRYIMTYLSPITPYIFRREDNGILRYAEEDGVQVEPETYLPVIPLALVLGVSGIGTGWATQIPPHDPRQIIASLRRRLTGDSAPFENMKPYWRHFKGTVEPTDDSCSFVVKGVYSAEGDTLHIKELPIAQWTEAYKQRVIEPLVEAKKVDLSENISDLDIDFRVRFRDGEELQKMMENGSLESRFKLTDTVRITNMHLFPPEEEHVKKYASAVEIMEEFYTYRLARYQERKDYMLRVLAFDRDVLKYKVQFIGDKIDGKIQLERRTYDEVLEDLGALGYPKFGSTFGDPVESCNYKYITGIGAFAFTSDRRDQLQKEYEKKAEEYNDLLARTPAALWLQDLDDLEPWLLKEVDTSKKRGPDQVQVHQSKKRLRK